MKFRPLALLVVGALPLGFTPNGCAQLFGKKQAPCLPTVAAVRNTAIVVDINDDAVIQDLFGSLAGGVILQRLQQDGQEDGNTFASPGANQQANLRFVITEGTYRDGTYYGSLSMSGWGEGLIHVANTTHSYTEPTQIETDLADEAYTFIHTGWHDTRPACQNAQNKKAKKAAKAK